MIDNKSIGKIYLNKRWSMLNVVITSMFKQIHKRCRRLQKGAIVLSVLFWNVIQLNGQQVAPFSFHPVLELHGATESIIGSA